MPGLTQTGLSSLCHFLLQQPRAGAAGEREAKWALRVLGSLRAAPPKGQLRGGGGIERFISLGNTEGASDINVQR